MSFIDELYKDETLKEEGPLSLKDRNILNKIIDVSKEKIRENKKSRIVEGYVFKTDDSIDIGPVVKNKPKKLTLENITENRIPINSKLDRLQSNLNAVVPFNSEYFFHDFSDYFLMELKKELLELGLKEVELNIKEVPVEYVVLKPGFFRKDTFKAIYYTNNKIDKALEIKFIW